MHPFRIEVPDLDAALVGLVRQIPKGGVATYGDLATALGDVRAAIWVSEVLREPPASLRSVAHRVVNANGEPGRFATDAIPRLTAEHVPVRNGRIDLSTARFDAFDGDRPLKRLQAEQEVVATRTRLTPLASRPKVVAAVDVSYRSNGEAVAAYVLMEENVPEPLWTTTAAVSVGFPYIRGYLAYRELPVYAELLRRVRETDRVAPLLLVDGSGILHPRRTGIATQLGVLADHPTVGVSKSLTCGTVVYDETFGAGTGRVVHLGETVAAALPPSRRGTKPIFISPGHRCTLEDAVNAVTVWRRGLRLPEPIRRADALSRSVAKAGLEAS